jgi:ribosome-associated protein
MRDLVINPRLTIPATQLELQYARSSGPGGQNVQKVNSKATLKWQILENPLIDPAWSRRVATAYRSRINSEGQLVLHSQLHRDQGRNVADVLAKLREILLTCEHPPKSRKRTKPTHGSQLRRLEGKRLLAEKKRHRGQSHE